MNQDYLPSSAEPSRSATDWVAICHRLAGYDFPWELNRSLELAVLKTFCIPRIAHLLHQTGEFEKRPQKRYDDTSLVLGNILKWGYDSPQGKAAITQMNRIHQRFDISNEDFLYVLSLIIYEPIRWNQHFGWRLFTPTERQALFHFWYAVGQRMGLQNMPQTDEAFEAFNQAYEAQHCRYHPDNAAVGNAVVTLMQRWFPKIISPAVPVMVKTVADDATRTALGWAQPLLIVRLIVIGGLRLRRSLVLHSPRRQRSSFITDATNKTYPRGYQLESLGPEMAVAPPSVPATTSRCPFARMRSLL